MHGSIYTPLKSRLAASRVYLPWTSAIALGLAGLLLIVTGYARPDDIGRIYASDVVLILVTLDFITRYFTEFGALDAAALAVARLTKGEPTRVVWGVGMLMFFISALLNNLAAVFAAAPIFLSILRQLGAPQRAVGLVLGLMLVNTNLGGAATPIGDFPAIVLMASGVISFNSYLLLAFPLCFCSAVLITWLAASVVPYFWARSNTDVSAFGRFAIEGLAQRMQFARPDWSRVALLSLTFLGMIAIWASVPPRVWPFHYTALAGAAVSSVIAGRRMTISVLASYDLRATVFMAIILAGAAMITATGMLDVFAKFLSAHFTNPVGLLFIIMFATTVAAAAFQAGPAAAAMLPVITVLANGPLNAYGDWVYVAFAGSICAGSSMFIISATSGPALVGEAQKAGIDWGVRRYLPYGVSAGVIQLGIVALWVAYAVVPGLDFWYALIGSVFILGGFAGIGGGMLLQRIGRNAPATAEKRNLHSMGDALVKVGIVVELIGIVTKVVSWIT